MANSGYCPTCDQEVNFLARQKPLRNNYVCLNCNSQPRHRALVIALETFFPNWRDLLIHESSPGVRGASSRFKKDCPGYLSSHYYPDEKPGSVIDGHRCENLEELTFENEIFDIHITQDVFEHVLNPANAFKEIARTLKPGGAHIFTVPIFKKRKTVKRADLDKNNHIIHLLEPIYHGNPIDNKGSLVTFEWGLDICNMIFESTGMFTQIVYIDDISRGCRGEMNEVLVTMKPL